MDKERLNDLLELQASLGLFPYWYTTVINHSRFKNISVSELSALSDKSKTNAEFLSASGQSEIDFNILKDAITLIDEYLNSSQLELDKFKLLGKKLVQIDEKMEQIVLDYVQSRHAEDNGEGAPIWCFVHRYAANLMGICILIEDFIDDKDDKLQLLRELNERKRKDPDADPSKEKIPEPV